MSIKEEPDDISKKIEESVEIGKRRLREKLMSMDKDQRFRVLREDLSLKGIETMCEWALPEEDYEICASVEEVKANNVDQFKVRFNFQGENDNKALVVKFVGKDGRTYYHADYLLHDNDDGAMVMLHKNNEGAWTSEWKSNDPNLFSPIGEAIDAFENSKQNK